MEFKKSQRNFCQISVYQEKQAFEGYKHLPHQFYDMVMLLTTVDGDQLPSFTGANLPRLYIVFWSRVQFIRTDIELGFAPDE